MMNGSKFVWFLPKMLHVGLAVSLLYGGGIHFSGIICIGTTTV